MDPRDGSRDEGMNLGEGGGNIRGRVGEWRREGAGGGLDSAPELQIAMIASREFMLSIVASSVTPSSPPSLPL